MTHEPDDHALLRAHLRGDPDAFAQLFRRHRDRLWAVALRTTGNPEEAADALQEAMISAYTRAGGFRGDAAVTTWLHRIVVNACLDQLRRARVRRVEALPDDLESSLRHDPLIHDTAEEPPSRAEAGERRRILLGALAQLSVEHREALVLVDMEGYPVAEAARILQCPVGTVKSRCARGRSRLAQLLEGTGLRAHSSHREDRPAGPAQRTTPTGGEPS
jgi:RNA polymerase sigma-70 factor (ECF subfamily)